VGATGGIEGVEDGPGEIDVGERDVFTEAVFYLVAEECEGDIGDLAGGDIDGVRSLLRRGPL
jgi:hypothetical protein